MGSGSSIHQPAQIDANLKGLFSFWMKGVEAFTTNLGLATTAGLPQSGIIDVVDAQKGFIIDVRSDYFTLRSGASPFEGINHDLGSANGLRFISFFEDVLGRYVTSPILEAGMPHSPESTWFKIFWNNINAAFSPTPTVAQQARWAAAANFPNHPDLKHDLVFNERAQGLTFASAAIFARATDFIGRFLAGIPAQSVADQSSPDTLDWDLGKNGLTLTYLPGESSNEQTRFQTLGFGKGDVVKYRTLSSKGITELGAADLLGGTVKAADLVDGFDVLGGKTPFAGYRLSPDGKTIDVSETDVFRAIERTNEVRAKAAANLKQIVLK